MNSDSARTGDPKSLPPAQEVPGSETVAPVPSLQITAALQSTEPPAAARAELEGVGFLAPPQGMDELGRLGSYRVLKILGAGGMGMVFLAEDTQLRRRVALKVMKPSLAAEAASRQRFVREAQSAAALHHDNIITIYQVGEDRGVPFLAMELLEGETLEDRLHRERRLPLAETLRIAREAADGLAAAHEQGLIHRDIKPANIWLEARRNRQGPDRVKILDFGLARAADGDGRLTQTGVVMGTPQYMAPEQASGEHIDHRGDLFSLGCMLYQLSTGALPFPGDNLRSILRGVLLDSPKPPRELNPDVPAPLAELILRLLAKGPGERPQSAGEVVEALLSMEREVGPAVTAEQQRPGTSVTKQGRSPADIATRPQMPPETLSAPPGGKRRKHLFVAMLGLAVLAAACYLFLPAVSRLFMDESQTGYQEAPALAEPFVVMGRAGKAEQKFAALAEAVAATQSGDTIEIRGDGPFVISPIDLKDKALSIRASAGSWPVLRLDLEGTKAAATLLFTSAPLVLEGLEFQRLGPGDEKIGFLIQVNVASIRAVNCRFLVTGGGNYNAFNLFHSPHAEFRNCHVSAPVAFGNTLAPGTTLILDNCVLLTTGLAGLLLRYDRPDLAGISVQLNRSTLVGRIPLSLQFHNEAWPKDLDEKPVPAIDVVAAANVMDGKYALGFAQFLKDDKQLTIAEQQASLRAKLRWREQRNAYSVGNQYLNLWTNPAKAVQGTLPSLAEWTAFWKADNAKSLAGQNRYQGGDLRAKLLAAPETVTAQDFRLLADSSGKGAGKDGKDLGADVDLVGPGQAYEKWKTTPAYQQWLKDIGQARAEAAAAEPFVVLDGKNKKEQKFPTLAEAVAWAQSGDTIEIRGDGPFVVPPIDLKDRALTLRAAAGSWPVLSLAPEAVRADLRLFTTRAALTLEGLEFHRDGDGKPDAVGLQHIEAQLGPVALTNCRFVRRSKSKALIAAVEARQYPSFQVRNCVFLGNWHAGLSHRAESDSRMVVANCLFLGGSRALSFSIYSALPSASLQLLDNTVICRGECVCFDISLPQAPRAAGDPRAVRVEARRNICTSGFLNFFYRSSSKDMDGLFDREHRSLAGQSFAVVEQGNLCGTGSPLASFVVLTSAVQHSLKPSITALKEWTEFWKLDKTDLIVSPVRFQKDLSPTMSAPESLTPQDFRVQGDGGKDLGANVDLVGPGPAYEKWQQTPAYQQWLKDSGQLKAELSAEAPFVVLDGKSKKERKFPTLAEAVVAAAQSGDTIEIRGDGPFVTPPLDLGAKLLRFCAGAGYRPVLLLQPGNADASRHFLTTKAPLVLEGLTLRSDAKSLEGKPWGDIVGSDASLYLTHCTLLRNGNGTGVNARGPVLQVRHCKILATVEPLGWTSRVQRECILENNVIQGRAALIQQYPYEPPDVAIQIRQNTLVVDSPLAFRFYVKPVLLENPAKDKTKPVRVALSHNVADSGKSLIRCQLSQTAAEMTPSEVVDLFPRLLDWTETKNAYTVGDPFLTAALFPNGAELKLPRTFANLAAWNQYLGAPDGDSVQGKVLFQGGDLRKRLAKQFEDLPLDSYRLHPSSAGKGAGPGGKDPGADVDLVGPGQAYEKWKTTPAYQQWLKDTGN